MVEPTGRDMEMAWHAATEWDPIRHHDAYPLVMVIARAIAAAREEGRREEHEKWAGVTRAAIATAVARERART